MSDTNKNPEHYLEMLKKIQEEESRLELKQGSLPFTVNTKETFDLEEESLLDNSEDPLFNKKGFYEVQAIINGNIKKGEIRDFVNLEKKLYLKSISKSGDSRFSLKISIGKINKMTKDWAQTDKNGYDLGLLFWELNEESGFHETKN